MAVIKGGANRLVRRLVQDADFEIGAMRRLSLEAINVAAATGKDATSTEQGVTVNGLRVGDKVLGVQSVNTTGGNAVWPATHFRGTVLTINTLNQLAINSTTNHVGESLSVWWLPRVTLGPGV